MEAVVAWVSKNAASKSHNVTLISARGSSEGGGGGGLSSNLDIIETIEPSWEGTAAEEAHYLMYKELLEKEYGSGDGIVWDNTWHCFSYLSAKKFPKMKIIHTNHGMVEWQKVPVKQLRFPRYLGLSRLHAKYMSSILKIPVRYVHHGIPLPPIEETKSNNTDNSKNGDYLLSINRIVREKGIEDSIDLAVRTRNAIKIAGDDIHVPDLSYVQKIRKKCQNTDGLAEYFGLVDNKTKIELIKKCKAVIACPKPTWIEAFGLYAVQANAYGKPVLALSNGGLNDIIVNQTNGFLAKTPRELQGYVKKVYECSPESCRRRVEKLFTDEIMTKNYLQIFESVLEDDPAFIW
ncbi:MAG TPA: glycosyltransferase [Nitrososphaeraceae archaeon]|nr:glycosyltransferase [Nitrososphaeraceae archaeon]